MRGAENTIPKTMVHYWLDAARKNASIFRHVLRFFAKLCLPEGKVSADIQRSIGTLLFDHQVYGKMVMSVRECRIADSDRFTVMHASTRSKPYPVCQSFSFFGVRFVSFNVSPRALTVYRTKAQLTYNHDKLPCQNCVLLSRRRSRVQVPRAMI